MRILLTCSDVPEVSARSLTEFIFDLTMLYDRLAISSDNPANPILYSPNFYRRWRRIERGLELKIGRLSKQSPLQIELIIGVAAGLIGVGKTFVELLRLLIELPSELEKRRLENAERRIKVVERISALLKENPEIVLILERDIKRLLGNEIRILKIEEEPDEF